MRRKKTRFKFAGGGLSRITCLAGLILMVSAGGLLTVFTLMERSFSGTTRRQDDFYRILREYDISADLIAGTGRGTEREYERLNRELDRLERRAIGVESWLSVLKRRKALTLVFPPSVENYRDSIRRALKAYPASQPLIAFSAAAMVKDTAINKETEEQLRSFLPLLTDTSFNTLRLSLYVLLGDFGSPEKAAQLPDDLISDGTETITLNLAIMKVLREDIDSAAVDIQTTLNSRIPPTGDFIRFAAEYYYDFGELRRSAELFSRLEDDAALSRQADALYLAGFHDSARSLWTILADPSPPLPPDTPDISVYHTERGLYNLAVTALNQEETGFFLEKLNSMESVSDTESRQAGLIRYSRLLPYSQAIYALESTEKLSPSLFPLIDLEIHRRYTEWQEPGRKIAEAWLLLDRHFENEDLYRWAAWSMSFQQYFDELRILLNRLNHERYAAWNWVPVYRAIEAVREGDIDTAESILRLALEDDKERWYIYANLGRILESRRSAGRALEQYEIAAAMVTNPKTASRLWIHIARCLSALARSSEARRALENALELDPQNITARLELERTLF